MRALTQWRFDRPLLPMAAVGMALVGGPWVAWLISEGSWRTLALLCVIGILPLALRWPVTLIFGAYVFVLPFSHVGVFAAGGGVTAAKLVGPLVVGALVAVGLVEKRFVKPPAPALWFIALVLWAITTLAWSVSPEDVSSRLPTIGSVVALYLAAVCFRVSERELRIVCLLAMIGGALTATAGVISGFEADETYVGRGTLSAGDEKANPNGVAQSLLLPFSLAIGLFLSARHVLGRVVAVVVIGTIGAAIFLTMSRASLLAITMLMCIFLIRSGVRWPIIVVVVVLAALIHFMPDQFFQRIDMVITGEEPTGAGRTDIWKAGLALLPRYGWLGSGLATWETVYTVHGGHKLTAPHNIFLGAWVELGVVGLALLLMIVFTHLRLARRAGSSAFEAALPVAIEAACYAVLVMSFFSDDLWNKAFWPPFILGVWISRNSSAGTSTSRSTADESVDDIGADLGHATTRH